MREGNQISGLRRLVGLPVRTLLHTFDFRGRSTRAEALIWLALCAPSLALAVQSLMPSAWVPQRLELRVSDILTLIFLVPFVALFARRLNDQGRSRWWVWILPFALTDEASRLFAEPTLPFLFTILNLAAVIGIFGLLFLEGGTPGANCFGENPRDLVRP